MIIHQINKEQKSRWNVVAFMIITHHYFSKQNKQAYMLLWFSETWNMFTGWVALLSNPTKCT